MITLLHYCTLAVIYIYHYFPPAQLVRRSVVSAVMVSLSDSYRSSWSSDTLLMLHLSVLNKLSTIGKKKSIFHGLVCGFQLTDHFITHYTRSTLYFFLDKRLGVKARLSGILVVIVGLLKKCQDDQEKTLIILTLLQSFATGRKKITIIYGTSDLSWKFKIGIH